MEVMAGIFIFMLFFILIMLALSVGIYLLMGFGLMEILKTNGEKTPALAFVPYLNTYLLGKVGSNSNGKYSKLGIALLVLQIVLSINSGIFSSTAYMIEYAHMNEELIILPTIFLMLITIAYMVIYYIVFGRIFAKYSTNGTLLTVLSILFGGGIFGPIFLFAIRKNKPINNSNTNVVQEI